MHFAQNFYSPKRRPAKKRTNVPEIYAKVLWFLLALLTAHADDDDEDDVYHLICFWSAFSQRLLSAVFGPITISRHAFGIIWLGAFVRHYIPFGVCFLVYLSVRLPGRPTNHLFVCVFNTAIAFLNRSINQINTIHEQTSHSYMHTHSCTPIQILNAEGKSKNNIELPGNVVAGDADWLDIWLQSQNTKTILKINTCISCDLKYLGNEVWARGLIK